MLSRTAENYLRSAYEIVQEKGYVRLRDISASLKVKPSTASEMLDKLDKLGLLSYEKHGEIKLTEDGKKTAERLNEKYKIFLRLFELAGVSPKVAYRDACILEHYVSDETNRSVQNLLQNLEKQGFRRA